MLRIVCWVCYAAKDRAKVKLTWVQGESSGPGSPNPWRTFPKNGTHSHRFFVKLSCPMGYLMLHLQGNLKKTEKYSTKLSSIQRYSEYSLVEYAMSIWGWVKTLVPSEPQNSW